MAGAGLAGTAEWAPATHDDPDFGITREGGKLSEGPHHILGERSRSRCINLA